MGDIARHAGIHYLMYEEDYNKIPSAEKIGEILAEHPEITHVSMVHSETTSGILNDIASVAKVVKGAGKTFIVDAMSSFGGVDIPVGDLEIDFIISSANKCIQGVPGFSFIICNREKLMESKGKARSLSLDLYDQWETMNKDGKWRFTSPTHVVLAFAQALKEMEEEGGIVARAKRYEENNRLLIQKMAEMGIRPYIGSEHQGPIITTFLYPEHHNFSFQDMYQYIKDRGYAIYPGKVTDATPSVLVISEKSTKKILKSSAVSLKNFWRRDKTMKFDGIIFDWAGTTVDYGCFAPVKAFIEAFEHYGITPTLEEVRKPMGMLKIDHVRTMLSMDRISQLWEEKQGRKWTEDDVRKVYELSESKILEIVHNYAQPKPYVVETVKKLREMGLKIGSTTGYTDEMMALVVPEAARMGYSPDCWFSPGFYEQKRQTLSLHGFPEHGKTGVKGCIQSYESRRHSF